nr:PREDICTED: zinc finger protein RFP isoform X1 [Anolis carolinensis]|eukprot:XP_016847312.1 PREDICTED: zinc finger protein RFP isoform X1 [Anolis carolinensis]
MEAEGPAKGLCEEATCPLCLDFFKDPVIIDCGHNFCRSCLAKYWGEPGPEASCPQCREKIPQRTLRPNRQLANMAELVQKLQEGRKKEEGRRDACKMHQEPLKLFCREDEAPICTVCDRAKEHRGHNVIPLEEAFQEYKEKTKLQLKSLRKKREEFKDQQYVQELRRKDYQTQLDLEKMKIKSLFEGMQRFLEEKQHFCLAQLENLEKEMEKRQDKTLAKLTEEISQLSLLITEMEEKCLQPASGFLQDIRNSLVRCEKNLGAYVPDASPNLNERLKITSQEISALQKVTDSYKESLEEALIKAVWEQKVNTDSCIQAPKKDSLSQAPNRVNVTLDPETACSRLILSRDLKNVRMLGCTPHSSNVFPRGAFVLGRERFTSGRHCWGVKVSSDHWAVGVSRDSVRKKESINPNTDDSIWAVGVKRNKNFDSVVCIFPEVDSFCLKRYIHKFIVVLNYEEGQVEFYDDNAKEFIYAFSSISLSGEKIRPFFFVPNDGSLKC